MLSPTPRTTVIWLPLLVSLSAFAARGVLKADGIIRVKGADINPATITIVPGSASAYTLPVSTKHVSLALPLDDVYLISVEREGCPTKEVYFDTRVPVEMHAREFDFPFMVTLEHLAPERMFSYAAPVGFVRYVHSLKDFGYETQYILRVEDELKERMEVIRGMGVDPKVISPIAASGVIDGPRGGYSAPLGVEKLVAEGNVASTVSEVPRLVHVVNAPADEEASSRKVEAFVMTPLSSSVPSVPLPARVPARARSIPNAASITSAPRSMHPKVTSAVAATVAPANVPELAPALENASISRSEEIITEPRRITRIVRFERSGATVHEYRKVAHAFGGVYYFQDGISITERAFENATGDGAIVNK